MKTNNKQIISGQYETYTDGNGRQIIDLAGGFGFQVPAVIEAVSHQADRMGLSNRVLMSEPLIALCRRLAELLPPPLVSSYVCSSGDEAFEGALKLCKGLKPKGNTLVFIEGGDYGSLTYGRCLNALQSYQEIRRFLGFKLVAVRNVRDLDAVDWHDCFAVCHTSTLLDEEGRLRLIDPALLDQLYAAAAKVSAPVIAVDVQSCLGSLGTLFGFQRYHNSPDIVVLGGALGGSAIPIGTYTCSEQMAYQVYGRSSPAKHGSTTAGNPMACVAAMAALDYVHDNNSARQCLDNGQILAQALNAFGAVACGAWVSLPLAVDVNAVDLCEELYQRGVYVSLPRGRELILRCPITARAEQIQRASMIIQETFSYVLSHAA
ncbi:aminotransferase class III-fold pyridoxal phosphate-dependent enzyme [Pseudomonas sp. 10S4]|uniref:aminotransferase class III-fold pyridoxal phosphate-dependent enzyme n=1 Tax=Pseudomonas sp. 10S4 TaxID=3048583 RepID=UPI002AC98357|nr:MULTISPECIES: aminotransferase class III-fold pyridoxal phosphate-dependent enzyme [unclassified Pseudomonas]MEB0223949.1 aminotransferase class III-fold pyridoxal phosphate-dependent enzyme [Pseudomonas sp. 5S1]MEB0297009.1 aminotransferase class III-fold pyridoxal phosphate-dependent enzyme [Pseudomonas sp. 10S4]WPX21288.1 aminotransferase class III-fold pyridoxal phosphate-dependent enzyme [Pseudomonas sp. 10S4]